MSLAKSYQPAEIEQNWYQYWEAGGHFAPSGEGEAYCIMIPPPNVTGRLHMGHAFQDTIMDTLIRYHRMQGDNTLWQPGMDHAGIATQMVVERLINEEGKTRHDYGREAFTEKIWEWKAQSGGTITRQLRRMGASCDWEHERFTMDEGLSEAVKQVFVRLYDMGIIYRGKRLVNWDPVLLTAVSDLEVLNEEEDGYMYHVRYPFVAGQGHDGKYMEIATTRPETILADGALAVQPGDERYQAVLGKMVHVPRTDRTIPIIEDHYVDPEFGTGCVKITPAHDFNDWQVGTRHEMEIINLLTPDAHMNENAPKAYQGMDRFEAREQIVKDLQDEGLMIRIEKHKLKRPRGDRSGSVIEPYLTDQWYVDLTREQQTDGRPGGKAVITDPSIEVVRNGKIKFVPQNWENTYFQWLENIQDWCISRQIWWGHRIPAWYDDTGNAYVAHDEQAAREKYNLDADLALRQDEDVLDTWFSSALWPFSTLGWPEQTQRLQQFYPTSVLVTGFDIIFFWVARMIMAGVVFMKDIPFHEVYIHGLVRDSHGQKMSKSKGNVLDPLDLIDGISLEDLLEKRTQGMMQPHLREKIAQQTKEDYPQGIVAYGTDALRFTFAAMATTGRDINFSTGRTEGYRNFCNKIWNAARFVLMNCDGQDCAVDHDNYQLTTVDKWIISRLQQTEQEVIRGFDAYRFDRAASAIYEFIWNEYCDWYLELTKPILNDESTPVQIKVGTRRTLLRVLETALRLTHPIMPYITEEIWQKVALLVGKKGDTIMREPYPVPDKHKINTEVETDIAWVREFILGIRKIRGEMDISPGKQLTVFLANVSKHDRVLLTEHKSLLQFVGRVNQIAIIDKEGDAPESAVALLGEMKIMIPLAGLIDKQAELLRLNKEIEKKLVDIERARGKLANSNFTGKAPAEVVEKERQKLIQGEKLIANLRSQVQKIGNL